MGTREETTDSPSEEYQEVSDEFVVGRRPWCESHTRGPPRPDWEELGRGMRLVATRPKFRGQRYRRERNPTLVPSRTETRHRDVRGRQVPIPVFLESMRVRHPERRRSEEESRGLSGPPSSSPSPSSDFFPGSSTRRGPGFDDRCVRL